MRDILLTGQKAMSGRSSDCDVPQLRLHWELDTLPEHPIRQFSYIQNPAGSLRWVFPSESKYPAYLALYNSAHWKARLYKLGTFAAFGLGLQKHLTSGRFWVEGKQLLPLEELLNIVPHDTYGIFTGTVGENRKSIIALAKQNRVSHFAKLAHSLKGENLLKNESNTLALLEGVDRKVLCIPEVESYNGSNLLLLTNVKPFNARETSQIEARHIEALREWYETLSGKKRLGEISLFQEVRERLEQIREEEIADPSLDPSQITRMITHLSLLLDQLNPDQELVVAMAHGDFTSWNMYVSDQALHVYDWELARADMPLLYDLFHFVYQSGILLLHYSYDRIERELHRALRLPVARNLIQRYDLDVNELHKLYLLHLVSYYLHIYVREPQVHMQVSWLLDTWDQALIKMTNNRL